MLNYNDNVVPYLIRPRIILEIVDTDGGYTRCQPFMVPEDRPDGYHLIKDGNTYSLADVQKELCSAMSAWLSIEDSKLSIDNMLSYRVERIICRALHQPYDRSLIEHIQHEIDTVVESHPLYAPLKYHLESEARKFMKYPDKVIILEGE